jgi:UDPglucose 6-dehydrogenase
MKIAIIGTGYVGLVTGAVFADCGNQVICVDNDEKIVNNLCQGNLHIFEPGLSEIVHRTAQRNDLMFSTNLSSAVKDAEIIFLVVGTPSMADGSFNLKYLLSAAEEVGRTLSSCSGFKVIVVKSTIPQGTSKKIVNIINQQLPINSNLRWAYIYNPETLSEGTAVRDFSKPERIIIGTISEEAFNLISELYNPFISRNECIIRGTPEDAELAKLFSNTALAAKIALVNEFSRIAEITPGADMEIIRKMVCEDTRIGYNFMFPSPGYGGSCFPKDVQGLVSQVNKDGYQPELISKIHKSNENHKQHLAEKIKHTISKDSPNVAVWGVTFKPNTDDLRDAASIPILNHLINCGANITVYDPQDRKAREIFGSKVSFVQDKYAALDGADALILLTEWKEFDSPNFEIIAKRMSGNKIFDMRNRWKPNIVNSHGFSYYGVGRNYPIG